MLFYWSLRYFAIVMIGTSLIAIITLLIIQTNMNHQSEHLAHLMHEWAELPAEQKENLPGDFERLLHTVPKSSAIQVIQQFGLLRLVGAIAFMLVGWIVIYIMTRNLVRPIREAVDAAHQIVAGHYDVHLNKKPQEREVYELMQAMRDMAQRLQQLESLRKQFLAGVTHELKTPLTSISGLIQAVNDGVVSGDEAKVFLENSLKHTQRLQEMVEDLLAFDHYVSKIVTIKKRSFDMALTLEAIITRWRYSQHMERLELYFEKEESRSSWHVESDPNRLEQIMINLLDNAYEAMHGSGEIHVELSATSSHFHITVRDTGPGIPAEEQGRMFESFFRGREKGQTVRGLGLGLPTSKLIARSLGGDLVFVSSDLEGTTFTLSLPH